MKREALVRAWLRVRQNPKNAARDAAAVLAKFHPTHSLALAEAPFDAHLLRLSPLYRRSRKAYLEAGGDFRATLVSSPRTLSSVALLENRIEYSPIQRELIWSATDPIERKDSTRLLQLRTFATSLFHEQSHRLLWHMLPPSAPGSGHLRRYLNLTESLVILADMALGDELGPGLAPMFHWVGVTYDPGTSARDELSPRAYRNYLQAALHATYLNLELYPADAIQRLIRELYPVLGSWATRAAKRALNLDRAFVEYTNPVWQKRHRLATQKILTRPGRSSSGPQAIETLAIPDQSPDFRLGYLWAEHWMDRLGLT